MIECRIEKIQQFEQAEAPNEPIQEKGVRKSRDNKQGYRYGILTRSAWFLESIIRILKNGCLQI